MSSSTIHQTAKKNQRFEITLPASSANIGPAFDAAAVALGLRMRLSAGLADEFSIAASGRDINVCQSMKNNLIIETYADILRSAGKRVSPLALQIQNEIPIGKGCGSSAAARLAGIALAAHFGKLHWSDDRILAEASNREGHPDNASACWLGGLTASHMAIGNNGSLFEANTQDQVHAVRIVRSAEWPLLLVVPTDVLPTEKARAVLPEQYSRGDAVANLQSATLLIAAFVSGRGDLLRYACEDHLHEPFRAALCPLLRPLRALTGKFGVLGVALSGAGPSVLLFLDSEVPVAAVRKKVLATLIEARLGAELITTAVAAQGACESRKISQHSDIKAIR